MNTNKEDFLKLIEESLKTAIPDVVAYVQAFTQQKEQEFEFERLAWKIWYGYRLDYAYTLDEIKQACSSLCARYADPGLRTMTILEKQSDKGVTRRFFAELVKVAQ